MDRRPTLLVLGGTTEATALVRRLAPHVGRELDLVTSFAGRTTRPTAPAGSVRIGGFGGADGLAAFLRSNPVDLVVDALHPFAAIMPFHAAEACERTGTDLVKLQRPPWTPNEG
ncbi:MAG: precorrin-6A/cobalt-precorrin-6A reductase, partial [Aquihabitans sp.]